MVKSLVLQHFFANILQELLKQHGSKFDHVQFEHYIASYQSSKAIFPLPEKPMAYKVVWWLNSKKKIQNMWNFYFNVY